jgi:hypothetical protein
MNHDIGGYLKAVELEADSEAIYYSEFGVTGLAKRIPRVLSLLESIKRHQFTVDVFLPLLSWCYALIFAPVFFAFRAVQIALALREKSCIGNELTHGKDLYLATSSGTNLAFLPQSASKPDFIIRTPFRGRISDDVLPDAPRIDLLYFVSLSDLAWAWWRAVLASWYLLSMDNGRQVLWGYTALEWFVVYRVLLQLQPKTVWVSNHHDRWLMLALSVPGACVNLVQHGRLFHPLPNGKQITYQRESKILGLAAIYALDDRSEKLFSDFIDCRLVNFYRVIPILFMMPWRSWELKHLKILVIGGSNKLDFYLELMDLIRSVLVQPVALAIRHHPLQKNRLSNLLSPMSYWELSSDEPVPESDLIVTYGSSIDDQLSSSTQARLITYAWSDHIDLPDIVRRVQSAANDLERN